jgi:hypothetical protein
MNRIRTLLVAAGAAASLTTLVGTPVGAAADPAVGKQVLDLLCASKDGAPVFTPMTIARCQAMRTNRGVVIEQLVCEGLLDGSFATVPTDGRPNRTNWFCFHGPVGT